MELYAIRYGINFKYASLKTIFRNNQSSDLAQGFIFLIYMARYKDKILMFDTGFRDKMTAEKYGVNLYSVNNEIEAVIGSTEPDIIFITHTHFDHTDNLDLYPASEIIISKPEYDVAVAQYNGSIANILKMDRVHIVDEKYLYDEKFLFKVIGGHTKGSSVVYFEEKGKEYVIAGDECYFLDNVRKNISSGSAYDPIRNDDFIKDAYDRKLIVLPYHDNRVFDEYERVSDNIVRII